MVTNRWTRKIVALLHDPPGKALVLRSSPHTSHEQLAEALQRIALDRFAFDEEKNCAKKADHIASAADRLNFPAGASAYWDQVNPLLTHPLAKDARAYFAKLPSDKLADLDDEVQECIAQKILQPWVSQHGPGSQKLYLHLWRLLYDELAAQTSLKHWIRWLPADTRQPDHSLEHHLSISAAIADAWPNPAFLVFSIGPVQDFIAAARRTQDLWMGSWLLSYLSWKAMESLAEAFGPDVVVFPSLRQQPLCDFWLSKTHGLPCTPEPADLARPTFPNKFVALLPAAEAKEAAKQAEKTVRTEWEKLADEVYEALKNFLPADDETNSLWEKQIQQHLEVYWSLLPWPGSAQVHGREQAESVIQAYRDFLQPPQDWEFKKVYDVLKSSGQYDPNWGTVYSLIYDLADRTFGTRKSLRDFGPAEEIGEKCTVCGQRAALRTKGVGAREFWQEAAGRLAQQGRYEIKPEGKERLCAVCTVKRFVQREVLAREFNLQGGFPSTSEVAAACFKALILDKLTDRGVAKALGDFLNHARQVDIPKTVSEDALPYLYSKAKDALSKNLLQLDGEYLFIDTWTVERLREVNSHITEAEVQEGRRLLGRLYEAVDAQPKKYYAILYMDGDHMGRWLSGTHEGLAKFGDILHGEIRQNLENDINWQTVLSKKRLITPAIHAAISGALASFSLKLVRWVIEERHAGRVIYAGGDDVLALLPIDHVFSAVRELRALFSGEVKANDASQNDDLRRVSWKVSFDNKNSAGYIVFDEKPLLTMGPAATASIGVAIAHHLQPLDLALQAARRAEKAAKEKHGRNAFAVEVLKRSGEAMVVGVQFYRKTQEGVVDSIKLLQGFCERLESGHISGQFPYVLQAEARTLGALPRETQQAELRRLLRRQAGEGLSREKREQQAEEWAKSLLDLADAIVASRAQGGGLTALEHLSNWLLVCSFIVRGGER